MDFKLIKILLLFSLIGAQDLPNDIRWVVNSKEYSMTCEQTYTLAWDVLHTEIHNNKSIDKIAVIMDLDETVLDNSDYQIDYLVKNNESYTPESWDKWVVEERAKLVPGSKDFILELKKHNVQIIYISNRMDNRLQETKNNMKKLGILFGDEIFLLRKDRADKKTIRRKAVYDNSSRIESSGPYKVIAYFGDAMGDFPCLEKSRFGKNQFIFPNPMYGKW